MSRDPERRLIAVLVTDIVDSTPIAERLGAERYKALFDEIARLMREQVERFGGTVAQHTGDGILALFGAPTAHEDDSERAVRAALAIHEALRPFSTDIAAAYGVEIAARAAVNTGPALVLHGDEPIDRLYNALGDTVTVAARLQGHAGTHGTIVGPVTARQVDRVFELDPLGELELKGRSEPVAACLVVGQRAEGPMAGIERTPLVGREAELLVLVEVLEELGVGRGAVAFVRGEPGIGKSRLVAEARAAAGDAVCFLEGAAVAYAENFPYWSIRGLFRDWLGIGAGAPDALVRLELKTALGRLGGGTERAYPFLATVVGAPLDATEAQVLDGLTADSVHRQTVEVVRDVFVALSNERPVCLVLDDLHWADASTLRLLEDLLKVTEEEPIGLLLLARSEREHGSWRLGESARQHLPHRLTEIELSSLDPETSRVLVGEAADAKLPPEVEAILAERAGGNPFFLEEALRDLVEQGALRRRNGSYELAVEISMLSVPLLVQEALQARLDRLEPATRDLIGVAAVVGRTFALPLLEALLPAQRLAPLLGELQRRDLIVEERRRPVLEYRFRHGLVQEVAYASLPDARRRELHGRTAGALELLHADSAGEIAGLLAHHLEEGGEREAAARWYERAGDAARRQYANDEAVSHYSRAVALYDQIGSGSAARHVLLKVAIGNVTAFDFAAGNAAYQAAFARAAPLPGPMSPTERVSVPVWVPDSIVPGYTYSVQGDFIARHLYSGLVEVDRDLTIVPRVAESFAISDDGMLYRFRLRPDALWHDGEPVTAADFVFAWNQVREFGTDPAFLLDIIAEAVASSDLTLEVRLTEPSNMFLYLLARAVCFPWPSHLGERLRADSVDLVGNGPFSLVRADERTLGLRAFEAWPHPRGNVRDVEITIQTSADDLPVLWRTGRFDFCVHPVDPVPGDVLEVVPAVNVLYLAFRATEPPFDDPRVRRAVGLGLDRQRLADALPGLRRTQYLPAIGSGLIPPPLPGHVHDIGVGHDPDAARALLEDAGFPGGRGLPEILALGWHSGADWWPWGTELDAQFERLGFRVRREEVPSEEFEQVIRERGHWFTHAWTPDVPDPGSIFEPLLAVLPRIDREDRIVDLLRQARGARNRDERLRLYGEADRAIVADRAAILPLGYSLAHVARRAWVDGVWHNGYDTSTTDEIVVDPLLRQRLSVRASSPFRNEAGS